MPKPAPISVAASLYSPVTAAAATSLFSDLVPNPAVAVANGLKRHKDSGSTPTLTTKNPMENGKIDSFFAPK
jgi:hypothetical protein